jgi:putative DNA primase/helicase
MNPNHGVDMQQLWAQVTAEFHKGARHLLSRDEVAKLNERNEQFSAMDPIEDIIRSTYDWDTKANWTNKTATDVLLEIGYDKPTKVHKNSASAALKRLSGKESQRSTGGRRVYEVPARRDEPQAGLNFGGRKYNRDEDPI